MDNKVRNRILFLLPTVILTIFTLIWYFYDSSRWYHYRSEFLWTPLALLHAVLPLFYFVAGIVSLVLRLKNGAEKGPGIYFIVASFILTFTCGAALVIFLIMTSGA